LTRIKAESNYGDQEVSFGRNLQYRDKKMAIPVAYVSTLRAWKFPGDRATLGLFVWDLTLALEASV
jgi:hypothetical protein